MASKARNVDIAGATARLLNAASRKKSKSEFTNFGLSDYKLKFVQEGGWINYFDVGLANLGYRPGISKKSIKYFNYAFAASLLLGIEVVSFAGLVRRYSQKVARQAEKIAKTAKFCFTARITHFYSLNKQNTTYAHPNGKR